MWAEHTANGFRLLNSPWYAKGISYLDTVEAAANSEGFLQFTRKVGTSGHSTYRILLEKNGEWTKHWAALQLLGCTYEESKTEGLHLLAVDVRPECDIHSAYEVMETGETAGVWQFEEGDVNHVLAR